MKYLGIDHGTTTCGIALGLSGVALPLCSVETTDIWETLTSLIESERIGYIVVGIATLLDGTRTRQTRIQEAFAREGQKRFPDIEWILADESLTSMEAHESKLSGAEHTEDAIAASLILQYYFDSHSKVCI